MYKIPNVKVQIKNILPDNRPITSILIVEDHENCPENYQPVHRTYDQDADADLWREKYIFGPKRTRRYLCLSKSESEGFPDLILVSLIVINDRIFAPDGYRMLSRTSDTAERAWRKRQICYKMSRRELATSAVTDIIICSRLKAAPDGFHLAGDLNGVTVCFKTGPVTHRPPPPLPNPVQHNRLISELESSLHYINISPKSLCPLPPRPESHDYEEIQSAYKLPSAGQEQQQQQHHQPVRTAPPRPPQPQQKIVQHNTLSSYHSDIDGVPFTLNPQLVKNPFNSETLPSLSAFNVSSDFVYDFQLERQVLCTIKPAVTTANNLKNPFFN